MEKVHEKTSKLINDVRRKKKSFVNKNDHSEKGENKIHSEVPYMKHGYCCYCTKVFFGPKYLLKHIFRRHPEKVLYHHRKLSFTDLGVDDDIKPLGNLSNLLDREFGYLKKELDCIKQMLVNSRQSNSFGELKYNSSACYIDEINNIKYQQDLNLKESEKVETNQQSCALNELKLKYSDTENTIQNLQKKCSELFQLVKDDVTAREDIRVKITLTEEKLLKQQGTEFNKLRGNMLTQLQNLQSMFLSQLQENNVHWKREFSEIKKELARLDMLMNLNAKKIESADFLEELEKKFENRIMQILASPKIFREKHLSSEKSSVSKQVVCSNSSLHFSSFKGSKNNRGNEILSGADLSNTVLMQPSSRDQLKSELEQKLMYFNVASEGGRISSAEFEEKMKLIRSEAKVLCHTHKNFMNIRDEINSYAEKMALSKLKQKRLKKIRFSDQGTNNMDTVSKIENEASKKIDISPEGESTGFIMSSFGGGGDCASHTADIGLNLDKKLISAHVTEIDMNTNKIAETPKNYNNYDDKMPKCSTPKNIKNNQNSDILHNSNFSDVSRKTPEEWEDKSDLESLSSWDDQNSPFET